MGRRTKSAIQFKRIKCPKAFIKTPQSGFLITNLIFILPVLVAGIVFFYLLSTHIEIQAHLYDICRIELEQTQQQVQKELSALMALNPVVKTFKTISTVLKLAMILNFTNPTLFIMFNGWLKTVGSIENAIIKLQYFIITSMTQTMRFGILLTKLKIYRQLTNYKKSLNSLVDLTAIRVSGSTHFSPAVEPKNKNTKLSEYKLSADFERKQKLDLQWEFNSEIVRTLNEYAILNRSFLGKCSYSLREEEPWLPIQIAVRY